MHFCILSRISRWPPKLVGKTVFGKKCLMTLRITWGSKISLKSFLHFLQNFKMADKYGGKTFFGKNWQMTMRTPWGSTILSKSLSRTISQINPFYAEFQDGHQKWYGNNFWKKCQMTVIPWASKILSKSYTVSEINVLLHFTQKFKMATKIAGKQFLAKFS